MTVKNINYGNKDNNNKNKYNTKIIYLPLIESYNLGKYHIVDQVQ